MTKERKRIMSTTDERIDIYEMLRDPAVLGPPDAEGFVAYATDWSDQVVADKVGEKSGRVVSINSVADIRKKRYGLIRPPLSTQIELPSDVAERLTAAEKQLVVAARTIEILQTTVTKLIERADRLEHAVRLLNKFPVSLQK